MEPSVDAREVRRVATGSITGFLAMGFFSGLSPKAPGTLGSAMAWLLMWPIVLLPKSWVIFLLTAAAVAGIYICQDAAKRLGVHDHSAIVWDEFVGMWLVLWLVPNTVLIWGLAFLSFRVFDVIKPWPIGWMDRRLSGGFGIMADDVMAAIYAVILVWATLYFWPGLLEI